MNIKINSVIYIRNPEIERIKAIERHLYVLRKEAKEFYKNGNQETALKFLKYIYKNVKESIIDNAFKNDVLRNQMFEGTDNFPRIPVKKDNSIKSKIYLKDYYEEFEFKFPDGRIEKMKRAYIADE